VDGVTVNLEKLLRHSLQTAVPVKYAPPNKPVKVTFRHLRHILISFTLTI